MDIVIASALPQLQHCTGNQVRLAGMSEATQRKRARVMAVLLGVVAVAVYLGFIWATSSGY